MEELRRLVFLTDQPSADLRGALRQLVLCCRYLLGHLSDRLHAGSVQVAVVLARLDELVLLDVLLHLLSGNHEVIISAVHLVVAFRSGRI